MLPSVVSIKHCYTGIDIRIKSSSAAAVVLCPLSTTEEDKYIHSFDIKKYYMSSRSTLLLLLNHF
jgi:hypothetical protein